MAEPVTPRLTFFLVAANYVPFAFVAAGALVVAGARSLGVGGRVGLGLAWLYLLPPLLGRVWLAARGRPAGRHEPDSRAYRTWWLLTQLQMVYNRVPLLEEALRLVPGAYAAWLTLWGSRVSALVFWAPGVLVTDRYLLEIARGVVLGTRCTLGSHVVTAGERGGYVLTVAPIALEAGCVVGALAGIGPGCRVHAGESVPAGRLLPPFSAWKDGRKRRPPGGEP